MPGGAAGSHHGAMSAATFVPASSRSGHPSGGTSALDAGRRRLLGDALRAARAFAGAAFDVVVLGAYEEEAGVRRKLH